MSGKNLAKAVGLVAKLEVDLDAIAEVENSQEASAHKITISMFDQEVMPVIDELYQHDQSMTLM